MIPEILATGAALGAASKIKEDSILGLIYKDSLQPSFQKIGKAIGTALEFSTIPFKLLQQKNDKVSANLQRQLEIYEQKLKDVPEENVIEVNPHIGVPIVDRLSYTTNDEIASLFTNLLTKASSSVTVNQAHPAFVQIIERLSVDEARILQVLTLTPNTPCITLRAYYQVEGYIDILSKATLLHTRVDLLFPDNMSLYLDNLVSLGIITSPPNTYLTNQGIYEPIQEAYNYNELKVAYENHESFKSLEIVRGLFETTNFGTAFLQACAS